jgi:hypothetical protein
MRKPTDKVLFHRRTRTVHEVRGNGNAYCGNGNRGGNYQHIQRNQVGSGAKPCKRCEVIAP